MCRVVAHCLRSLVASAVLGASPALAAAQAGVADVRVERDYTRITLEFPREIRFSLMSLTTPDRLVLELDGVEPGAALSALAGKLPATHPYLGRVRITRLRPGVIRLRFELKSPVEPRVSPSRLPGGRGFRLVLDIYPERRDVAAPPAPADESIEEALLEARINEQAPETVLVLRRKDRRLYVRAADLQRWRLRLPAAAPLVHGREAYYPLDALRGLSYRIDDANQALSVQAPPGLMMPTLVSGLAHRFAAPPPAPPGAFANYEIVAGRTQGDTSTGGFFELGAFGGWGVGASTFLARDAIEGRRFIRLESSYTRDLPSALQSFRLGDGIGRTGTWGRAVRFGGVQWGTSFATQPGLVTFPMPGISGEAVVPSTVDLYVNNALTLRRDVPSGPFSIADLPVVSGRGEARLVVRDLLGREQVIVVPYYASPRLLQEGLHDYSYETGLVRENFGIASNDYGRGFATGTHRLGITDSFTGEVRGEVLDRQYTLGVGGAVRWRDIGVFNAAAARSDGDRGTGALAQVGVEHQARRFSVGGSTQVASERFTQLGLQPEELAPRQLTQLFAGLAFESNGSLGLGYARQAFRDREDTRLVNATYSTNVGRWAFLTVSVLRLYAARTDTSVNVFLTLPLGPQTSASVSATARHAGKPQSLVQAQRSLPAGSGYGYRVLASLSGDERREAGIALQNDVGTYTLEAGETLGVSAVRASAAGAFSYLGGSAYASRRITDSFGVVQVPGYPGVRVYADNQLVARTGRDGSALLPRLRPYERNDVAVEQADLPLDAQVDAVQHDVVPYFRSGVVVPFALRPSRGALLTVLLDNGEPVPAGATAELVGEQTEFPVGLRGELYLTGLAAENRVRVTWRGSSCEFPLAFARGPDPLPHLGTYTCRGVRP
jgi:outer membrane usher protein